MDAGIRVFNLSRWEDAHIPPPAETPPYKALAPTVEEELMRKIQALSGKEKEAYLENLITDLVSIWIGGSSG